MADSHNSASGHVTKSHIQEPGNADSLLRRYLQERRAHEETLAAHHAAASSISTAAAHHSHASRKLSQLDAATTEVPAELTLVGSSAGTSVVAASSWLSFLDA